MKIKELIVFFFMILIGFLFLSPSVINSIYVIKTKSWIEFNAYIINKSIIYNGVVSNKTGNKTSDTYEYQIKYFVDGDEITGNVFSKKIYDGMILIKYNPYEKGNFVSVDSLKKSNVFFDFIGLIIIFMMFILIIQDYRKNKKMVNK